MKYLIVAGGHGTRLWPLSRKNSPKQFEKLIDGQSTLQMMYTYVSSFASPDDIFISTNIKYVPIIQAQLPELPASHIIGEPERRDLLAAIGFALTNLRQLGTSGPISILWSDHLVKDTQAFADTFTIGSQLLQSTNRKMVFVGEQPTYPEQNLGWIKTGDTFNQESVFDFAGWHYRPPLETAQEYFRLGYLWNTGYFITTLEYVWEKYQELQPEAAALLTEIGQSLADPVKVATLYSRIPKESFDDSIVKFIPHAEAAVIKTRMGWTDPGTLYAFKDALVGNGDANYVKGKAIALDTTDSMIFNAENGQKLVAAIGLQGMIVINTPDALLVVHKDDVPKVKQLVEKLGEDGLEEYQ